MNVEYVRDKYAQYYLLVHSNVLFPECEHALVALDGSVYLQGISVFDRARWTIVSKFQIPYVIFLKLENQRKILEKREIELKAEAEN